MKEFSLKERFQRDGYVVVRSALSADALAELRTVLEPMFSDFRPSAAARKRDLAGLSPDGRLRQPEIERPTRLSPALRESIAMRMLRDIADQLLGTEARYTYDHAICKTAHSDCETAWHQDQAYLGSHIHLDTVNFWIPLCDVDHRNGALGYAPGTHRGPLRRHHRHAGADPGVLSVEKTPASIVIPKLRAGDLSVHHPKILHGAGPNRTDADRLAWAVHFSAKGRAGYFSPRNIIHTAWRFARGGFDPAN